jgi:hypothetical protein
VYARIAYYRVISNGDKQMTNLSEMTAKEWIKAANENDSDDLINAIKSVHNCREVEIGLSGGVWIADPQRGHWLDDDALAHIVHVLKYGI